MKGDDRNFSDAIEAWVEPRTRRQVGDGTNVQVITVCDLGSFAGLGGLTGESEDHLIDELGASEPVEIFDSPQYRPRERQVVIHEAADNCPAERIIAQRLSDGASDRPPPTMRILHSSVSRRLHTIRRSQCHSTRPVRLLANIVKAARGCISLHAAMKTNVIASRIDLARIRAIAEGD